MQIEKDGFFHLTYCTKIHPGHGWGESFRNIRRYVPALKERLAPRRPFGLGLRLSAVESTELLQPGRLPQFQDFLDREGIYVFTLNGFPYGPFHGPVVKEAVFAPDWQDMARVEYTRRLVEILRLLLPPGMEGSISTLPLSYKPWVSPGDRTSWERIIGNLADIVAMLMRVRERDGKLIHLNLEPEPDGLLENCAEVAHFYEERLLPRGAPQLAAALGISPEEARVGLLTHLQVCLDTCHLAVVYEDAAAALNMLEAHGIRVGKVQITAGLKAPLPPPGPQRAALAQELEVFTASPYLHQVIAQKEDGELQHFRDLAPALPLLPEAVHREWRIHFHVPPYMAGHGQLRFTRDETREVLCLLRQQRFCRHLELETYTWDFLPPELKADLLVSLEREYRWTLDTVLSAED